MLGIFGLILATIGGLLLATQMPSDAIMYRNPETGEMTLDSTEPAMKRYQRKTWWYRIGIFLLLLGACLQFLASMTSPACKCL